MIIVIAASMEVRRADRGEKNMYDSMYHLPPTRFSMDRPPQRFSYKKVGIELVSTYASWPHRRLPGGATLDDAKFFPCNEVNAHKMKQLENGQIHPGHCLRAVRTSPEFRQPDCLVCIKCGRYSSLYSSQVLRGDCLGIDYAVSRGETADKHYKRALRRMANGLSPY